MACFPAIYLGDPPTFMAYKAILKTSADVTVETPIRSRARHHDAALASLLRGYLAGLQRTGSTGTTYSTGWGVATDDTNTVVLSLVSGTINAATVGANGIDAGALTATATFHAFAIGKTDGTAARLLSASPTIPDHAERLRLQAPHRQLQDDRGRSQIIPNLQIGDDFL